MIDWNDNAKAAVEYFVDWLRADYSYIANLEDFYNRMPRTSTQTKTVADAEQEGEKWTHGDKCYCVDFDGVCEVVLVEGSQVVVRKSSGNLGVSYVENLDPIKPTISECDAKALELFANKSHRHGVAWAVKEYLDGHDII